MRVLRITFLVAMLAGCATDGPDGGVPKNSAKISVPFNPGQVEYVNKPGTAEVSGVVALEGSSGPIVGSHAKVRLVPVADYSKAVMNFLFQGSKAYFHNRSIVNPDQRYPKYMRYGNCDPQGRFVLYGVPAGEYYVYATMANHDQGVFYAVMEPLTVVDGKKYTVELDGV